MLKILADDQWPGAVSAMREGFAGKLNVYRMMAHNPPLLAAWENLRNHVVLRSALTPQQSEIVILRTGWRRGSRYEWMHHVSRGRKCGLSNSMIEACAQTGAQMSQEESLLIEIVDALLDGSRISPPLLQTALQSLGKEAILDVMATIGMYSTLAFIIETFEVPVDQDIAEELAGDPIADKVPHRR